MQRRSTTDGYLTVLLSLTITIFLSLIMAFFASARLGAVKMRAECVTEIAMESVLAEYNRVLFDRYDLLAVDMSYGSAVADICNTEEHLRKYVQMNLSDEESLAGLYCQSIKIPEYTLITDGNGAVLRRQILAYMTAEPLEKALTDATDNLNILRAQGYDTRDVEQEANDNYEELKKVLSDHEMDESVIDSSVVEVQQKRSLGVLTLAHPDRASISDASVTLNSYSAHQGWSRGTYSGQESLSATERLLIDQYLLEKCGNYTAPRDGSRLQYQLEYLVAGKSSDYANLEAVAKKLLFWREASNFTYILTDNTKCAFAGALATAASILLLTPELQPPLKMAILFSWSFAESIADIRTLFEGGRVPLIKTSDTWKLTFSNILSFQGTGGTKGLNYEEYLRILMLLTDLEVKTKRLSDLIEMDLRETDGNLHFRLDACLDCMTAQVGIRGSSGFEGTLIRTRGYETKYALE